MTARKAFTKRDAAKHLLALRRAQESFLDFIKFMQPDWELSSFQIDLINTLDQIEKDELPEDNILVTMPPRFAKSTFCTVYFPAYCMARHQSRFIMSCSYNAQLATDFGRQVRTIIEDPRMAQIFPHLALDKESRAADVWRTLDGGAYFAVGIGGTTSGRPANFLILDDPIKSRDDAESITQRNKTWNYYASALSTRLQPDTRGIRPKTIVVLTRWHPDDVAGRLMRSEDWKEGRWRHVNFQAITTRDGPQILRSHLATDHPMYLKEVRTVTVSRRYIYRQIESSLWESRFPLEDLKRRRRLNPREFASLYQQEPYIQGGNLIRSEWWRTYPKDMRPESFSSLIISADTAFKKNEQADYSVAAVLGMDTNGDIYIVDIMRGKFEFPELKQRLIHLNTHWRGRGLRATYIEDKASGQSLIQELKRHSGLAVIPYKTVHDKVARVNAILPIIEGGRVFLPDEAPWLDTFVEEATQFPGGTHDDQVDAVTMGIDILSRTSMPMEAASLMANLDQSLNAIDRKTLGKSLNEQIKHAGTKWMGWGL